MTFVPGDPLKCPGRYLFYVENAHTRDEAEHIGMTLYVEQTIFSRFSSMRTDILGPMAASHLHERERSGRWFSHDGKQ